GRRTQIKALPARLTHDCRLAVYVVQRALTVCLWKSRLEPVGNAESGSSLNLQIANHTAPDLNPS
ncbi:MAG TPA: hypothetical protein VE268_12330, partial [Herpetosiphonaceae bacterium]|nr:hypothetical protein [Herpetosiphonaceae bacterium]